MTRLYLDTEFNGHCGNLISMALVTRNASWYGVRSEAIITDPWVEENVVPKLHHGADGEEMTDEQFRASLHAFLQQFDNPEIVCDWNADAAHFCECLAGGSYETSLDYACRITILKTPPGEPVSPFPHNALEDASALMLWNEARLAASEGKQ